MFKKISLGLLVAALFLFARPTQAALSAAELQIQINAILARIAVLQEQIDLLRNGTASSDTFLGPEVVYPKGGEVLKMGEVVDVVWNVSDTTQQQYFDLYVQTTSSVADNRYMIASALPVDASQKQQTYAWEVGTQGKALAAIPSGYYYFEVCPWGHGEYSKPPCDRSDAKFKVVDGGTNEDPNITVTYPNGGETIIGPGYTYQVTWESSDVDAVTIDLCFRSGGTQRCYEMAGIPDSGLPASVGSYDWYIDRNAPWFPAEQAKIRVSDIDSTEYDKSNSWFEIEDGRG